MRRRSPHPEERRKAPRLEGCSRDRERLAPWLNRHTVGRSTDGVKPLSGATIYILRCSDGSYYTGITRRPVEERVSEHALGLHEGYTFTRRPVTLVHAESYERIDEAIAPERRIKGWSRVKKEAYIRGDFEALATLSRRRSPSEP
jgi:putative endonuclease